MYNDDILVSQEGDGLPECLKSIFINRQEPVTNTEPLAVQPEDQSVAEFLDIEPTPKYLVEFQVAVMRNNRQAITDSVRIYGAEIITQRNRHGEHAMDLAMRFEKTAMVKFLMEQTKRSLAHKIYA